MDIEEMKKRVIEEVKEKYHLENEKDYIISRVVKGNLATYIVLGDLTEHHNTLMAIGIWAVIGDKIHRVNIPVEGELWDDYDYGEEISNYEQEKAMPLFGM